jgi:hypothetical protein
MQPKYRAIPTTLDGILFASKKEANRYSELKLLQKVGAISELVCHPRFLLLVQGVKICTYVADFQYRDSYGAFVVEDVKSVPTMTAVYRLKRKLLQATKGITIREVF